jgi:hypothetical protein
MNEMSAVGRNRAWRTTVFADVELTHSLTCKVAFFAPLSRSRASTRALNVDQVPNHHQVPSIKIILFLQLQWNYMANASIL